MTRGYQFALAGTVYYAASTLFPAHEAQVEETIYEDETVPGVRDEDRKYGMYDEGEKEERVV